MASVPATASCLLPGFEGHCWAWSVPVNAQAARMEPKEPAWAMRPEVMGQMPSANSRTKAMKKNQGYWCT